MYFFMLMRELDAMAEFFEFINQMRQLNIWSMMLRIALAMLVGGMIGFERERKGRAAGFRTYMLVAMASAVTVILSQYLAFMMAGPWKEISQRLNAVTDISRFAAQVINGVGFLGAGTIIVTGRQEVKGLTTAAGLWASACIGISIGAGFYECVLVAILLVVFCMKLLPILEDALMANSRTMNIYVEMDTFENLANIVNRIKNEKITLYDVEIEKEKSEHMSNFSVLFITRLPRKKSHAEVLALLSTLDGIAAVEEV